MGHSGPRELRHRATLTSLRTWVIAPVTVAFMTAVRAGVVVVLAVGIESLGVFTAILSGAVILVQMGRLLPSDRLFALRPRLMLGDLGFSPIRTGGVRFGCTPMLDCLLSPPFPLRLRPREASSPISTTMTIATTMIVTMARNVAERAALWASSPGSPTWPTGRWACPPPASSMSAQAILSPPSAGLGCGPTPSKHR